MTALTKYQKLESPGLWRDVPEGQRREVVVAFGEASLVLSDPRNGSALSHWSLPAVRRVNPGGLPAIYAPDAEADSETLELDDPTMIGAIETVRGAILRARARPGRLRGVLLGGFAVVAVGLVVFWLPEALVAQTASMVPASKRMEIGRAALGDLTRLTGQPCAAPLGLRAATRLGERVLGTGGGQILMVRDGLDPAVHLPGGLVVVASALVEQQDDPHLVASVALVEKLRAAEADPLVPLLRHAGLGATFRLLTSGSLPDGAVAGYAETLLRAPPVKVPDETVLAAFRDAGLASTPYAYWRDPSGETVLPLIEADPFRDAAPPPLLPDGDWISLQAICQS
jgi:hypothetical protein